MKPTRAALLIATAALLFLAANRAAYKGFFSGDDLDNIAWTRVLPAADFAAGLVTPRYQTNHFRPVGHGTFAALGHVAGLRFGWYVAVLHVLHLATAVVLALLLARLRFPPSAVVAGAAFFLFQMALFQALWKPMYIFDVWCGLFTAAALYSWISGRTVQALGLLWLAVKSKEHAVMLVGVFLFYDLLFGQRRWKAAIGAGLIAAIFAIQAVFSNREQGEAYKMAFTLTALLQTVSFYSSRVLILPYLGLLLIPAAVWVGDRRAWWGAAAAVLLISPMLFLPGRMFSAYLYVPMLGVAIVVAACAVRADWRVLTAAGLAWGAINWHHLRTERRAELAIAQDSRAYFEGSDRLAREQPHLRSFVYSGFPEGLQPWGVQGALRLAYGRLDLNVSDARSGNLDTLFASGPVGIVSWNPSLHRLVTEVREGSQLNASYIDFASSSPVWQLGKGWYELEAGYRWIEPVAFASLRRPSGATAFEVKVNAGEVLISRTGKSTVRVFVDGREAGAVEFTKPGWSVQRIALNPAPEALVTVELRASPEFRPGEDSRILGIAVGAFGFR